MRTANDITLVFCLIALGVVLRLVPHPANFAPITAIALFAGTYLSRRSALLAPLAAMVISDLVIGLHALIPLTWGCFALFGMFGWYIRQHKNVATVIGASLVSSTIFYLVTNWGVWQFTSIYAHSLVGLGASFVAAIPFFRNTVLGDLVYTGALFGVYETVGLVLRRSSSRSLIQA